MESSILMDFTTFNKHITANFSPYHDNYAVVAYAKTCSDILMMNGFTIKINFCQIWIMMEKFIETRPWNAIIHLLD